VADKLAVPHATWTDWIDNAEKAAGAVSDGLQWPEAILWGSVAATALVVASRAVPALNMLSPLLRLALGVLGKTPRLPGVEDPTKGPTEQRTAKVDQEAASLKHELETLREELSALRGQLATLIKALQTSQPGPL
jgi:hypothetical protein